MKRSQFSSKIGFILSAAGSAVGLGNIWRFPYLAAKYGGGMFLFIYIILVLTFGATIMLTEIAIGRKTGMSPIGAFTKLKKQFRFVGIIEALSAFLICTFYGVISGWVLKYFFSYLIGHHTVMSNSNYFNDFISKPFQPIIWQVVFVLITAFILVNEIKDGLEKVNKIIMPLLVILTVGISIYCITLPNAFAGIKYFLIPNFAHFSFQSVIAAIGQMFYSMSLAMGVMITYGSYLDKKSDIEHSVGMIEIFDTGIAVLAGIMIICAVFSFNNGEETALNQGAGLMFVTLPKIFESMYGGSIIGTLFFLLVAFAALTSLISIMEVSVATITDQFKLSRKNAVIILTAACIILGIPSSLGNGIWSNISLAGFNIMDFIDFLTSSIFMPLCALVTCILTAYVLDINIITDEIKLSSKFRREKLFNVVIKYIAPIFLLIILISSILNSFNVVTL